MRSDVFSSLYLQASSWFNEQLPLGERGSNKKFDWDKQVTAHKHLSYQPCYDGFQCARLQMPMDWQGTSEEAKAGKTVEIAIVKVEATVPVTDPTYGGAIVTNPGGPGGSGVDLVLHRGYDMRTVLSAGPHANNSAAKNFDIIGFDPRGVNYTRPAVICHPDHLTEAASTIEEQSFGMIGTSNASFDNLWAMKQATSGGCSKRLLEDGIIKHVSTAAVARDIIEIVERHGEWREKEAQRLLSLPSTLGLSNDKDAIRTRTAYKKGAEMVQYWGFSYGTILGAHLAAMFPDRISRALLDGVSDSFDYMAGGWVTNLPDTDELLPKMAEYCDQGGPKNCALHSKGGPKAIAAKVQKAMESLKANPIPVPGDLKHGPMIVTYNDLKKLFTTIVYTPIRYLPLTAQVMQEVLERNGTSLANWKRDNLPDLTEPLSEQCKKDGPYSPSCHPGGGTDQASSAITCGDAFPGRYGQSKEDFRKYADGVRSESVLLGDWWASIQMSCTAWEAQTHWKYEGDFHSKTANPILFAGNTFDPVTPLRNAFKMVKGFDGAGLLHQNSEGHCTIAAPSLCSGKAIRHYFQTGELPGEVGGLNGYKGHGAYCEPSRLPFDGYGPDGENDAPEGETDVELWKALVGLNLK